jgi:hypothetical protein
MLLPTTEDTGNTMPAQQVSADGGGHGWTLEQAIPAGEGEDTLGMVEAEGKGRALEKLLDASPLAGECVEATSVSREHTQAPHPHSIVRG